MRLIINDYLEKESVFWGVGCHFQITQAFRYLERSDSQIQAPHRFQGISHFVRDDLFRGIDKLPLVHVIH